MSLITRLKNRLHLDRDLHDEIAFHRAMRPRQHLKAGADPDEAMKRAREQFGGCLSCLRRRCW